MALSGRELLLVIRARDEASRTLRRISRTMNAAQRESHRQSMNTVRQQDQNLQRSMAYQKQFNRSHQDYLHAQRTQLMLGKQNSEQYAKNMHAAKAYHTSAIRGYQDEQAAIRRVREEHLKNMRTIEQRDAAKRDRAYARMDAGAAMTTIGVGMAGAGALGLGFFKNSIDLMMEYREQSALTLTQVDKMGVSLKRIENIGKRVADAVAVPFEEIQPALYDIFSSIDVSVKDAGKMLKRFAKDAVGGATDIQTATRANVMIMNAFKVETKDMSKVSDFMFQLVRKGVGTYDEFAKTLGRSIPSAARAGATYHDLGGAVAFLTREGLSAAMASTAVGRAYDAISNPNTLKNAQKIGLALRDQNGNYRDMVDIVEDLREKLSGMSESARSEALYELFKGSGGTIQAMRFFNNALKSDTNFESYKRLTEAIRESGGAAKEAYDKMKDTPEAKIRAYENDMRLLRIEIGEHVLPAFLGLIGGINDLIDKWQKLSPETRKMITVALAVGSALLVLSGIFLIIGGAIMMAVGAFKLAGVTLSGFLAFSAGGAAILAGIAAAGYLIYKNWDKIAPVLSDTVGAIKDKVGNVAEWLKTNALPKFQSFAADVGEAMGEAKDNITTEWGELKTWFNDVFGETFNEEATKAREAWEKMLIAIEEAWNLFKSQINWEEIKKSFRDVRKEWDKLKTTIEEDSPEIIVMIQFFSQTIRTGMAVAGAAIGALAIIFGNLFTGILKAVASFIRGFIKMFSGLIDVITGIFMIIRGIFTANGEDIFNGFKRLVRGQLKIVTGIFTAFVQPIIDIFDSLKQGIFKAFVWLWEKLVGHSIVPDIVEGIKNVFRTLPVFFANLLPNMVSKIIDHFQRVKEFLLGPFVNAFSTAKNRIGSALAKLPGLMKAPVDAMVRIWKSTLWPVISAAINFFGGDSKPKKVWAPTGSQGGSSASHRRAMGGVLNFANAGVLPGYTPGRDVHQFFSPTGGRLALSGGEAIMRPEFTRLVGGKKGVEALNRAARRSAPWHRAYKRELGFFLGGVMPMVGNGSVSRHSGYPWASWAGDLNGPGDDAGKLVRAWKQGTVSFAGWGGGNSYGNYIRVNHPTNQQSLYAHLSAILVRAGQAVSQGQGIGRVGSTGKSTGPHLHFEVKGGTSGPTGGGGARGAFMAIPDFLGKWMSAAKDIGGIGGTPWADVVRGIGGKILDMGKAWLSSHLAAFSSIAGTLPGLAGVGGGLFGKAASIAGKMFGWGGGQLAALKELVNRESGWNPRAQNPTSTAFGLFQFLDGTWAGTGIRKTADPVKQIIAGLRYIRSRYGSPAGALQFHNAHNWYDRGGYLPTGTTMTTNKTGSPEPILTVDQWKTAKQSLGMVQKFASGGTWDPRRHPRDPKTGSFISWQTAARRGIKWVARSRDWRDLGGAYNLQTYLTKLFGAREMRDILDLSDPDRDASGGESSGSGSGDGKLTPRERRRRERRQNRRMNVKTAQTIKAILEDMNRIKPKGIIKAFEDMFDKNIGPKRTKAIMKEINKEAARLNKVFKRYQELSKKLEDAREKLRQLRDDKVAFREATRDAILDFGSLASVGSRQDIFGNELPLNATSIQQGLQERLAAIREWGANIQRLRQMGYNDAVVRQVIEMGPEAGASYAKALIAATPAQVTAINQTTNMIAAEANRISTQVANQMYDAGIKAAEGLIAGLKSRMEELRKVARRLAEIIVNQIKRELGIRSPSKVAIELATNFGQTYVHTLAGHSKAVGLAAKQMAGGELNQGIQNALTRAPVGVAPGGPASVTNVKQEITINTNEIDPRRNGAELGWMLIERYRV